MANRQTSITFGLPPKAHQSESQPTSATAPVPAAGLRRLHDVSALRLWRRPALPHDGGLQPQTEAAPAWAAPKEALQALGTDVAEESGVGA